VALILKAHCRTAFGREETEQLVALCSQTLTRQIGQEMICLRAQHLTEDILSAQKRKKHQVRLWVVPPLGVVALKESPDPVSTTGYGYPAQQNSTNRVQ